MGTLLPVSASTIVPKEVANLTLPTPFGGWETHAFEWAGSIHLCLCRGRSAARRTSWSGCTPNA